MQICEVGSGEIGDADKDADDDVVRVGDSVVQNDEAKEGGQSGQEDLSGHAVESDARVVTREEFASFT